LRNQLGVNSAIPWPGAREKSIDRSTRPMDSCIVGLARLRIKSSLCGFALSLCVFIEIAFSRGVELSWILDPARIQIFRRNVREEEQSLPSIFILLHTCSTDRTSSRFQLVSAVAAASDDYFCDVTLTDDLKLRISGMTFKDPNVTSAKRNLAIPRDSSFSRKLS